MRRLLLFFIALAVLLSLVACDSDSIPGHAEMRIPIEGYREAEAEGFDAAYTDGERVVAIIRISFEAGFKQGIPETLSAKKFAELYMKETERDEPISISGNIPYYEYRDSANGGELYYLASFYRSKHAYFLVLFATDTEDEATARDAFLAIADSIYFVYGK